MRVKSAFEWWVFDAYRVEPVALAIYRILFALYMLLFYAKTLSFEWIARFPDAFFHPPFGPMRLFFSEFPGDYFFTGLELVMSLSLIALLIGYRTRWASLLTGLCFFVGFGFSYSFGKTNHTILLLLIPLVMAFSGWGKSVSYDSLLGRTSGRRAKGWPVALMAFCLGFAMFTAGFGKLLGGWLDPDTQAVQGHLVRYFYVWNWRDYLAPFFISFSVPVFWEALDYGTVLFEGGFLVAAFHPALIRIFAAVAVFFHLGVLLMLNINFASQLVVYALFVDWTKIAHHLPRYDSAQEAIAGRLRKIPPVLIVVVFGGLFYAFGSPLALLYAATGLQVSYNVLLLFSAAAVVGFRFLQLTYRGLRHVI